jgi:hypothetical protein
MCAAKIRRAMASFGCDPCGSAKEGGHKGTRFLSSYKADPLGIFTVRPPWAREAPPPILASAAVRASAPGTGAPLGHLIPGIHR